MQQKSFLGHSLAGFHRINYTEWGQPTSMPSVICVHGLTRNGRDFDKVASALEEERQVLCPDMPGRGQSEWFSDPSLYSYPQYANDMAGLIARSGQETVDWIGTSMGGILGMTLAAQPKAPIRRLVVNDVGPFLSRESLARLAGYVGVMPEFVDLAAAERYLRQIHATFGITDDADWRNMAENSVRKLPNGKLTLGYDPAIATFFKDIDKDVDFWVLYDRITCPVLVIRGERSDILSAATAEEMTRRGPKAQLVEIPNVGHAPALMDARQISLISDFLRQ